MKTRPLCFFVTALLIAAAPRLPAGVSVSGIARTGGTVSVQWTGGHGPYWIETSGNLQDWSAVGDPLTTTSASLPATDDRRYVRVVDADADGQFGALFGLIQSEQGEFGSLLARHRLKTRLWLYKTTGAPHTSPSFTAGDYFRKLLVVQQWLDGGLVRTRTGSLESLGTVATPTAQRMTVTIPAGEGLSQRTYVLTLEIPYAHTATLVTPPNPSDPTYSLTCTYATPQPELQSDLSVQMVTSDATTLGQLDPSPALPPPERSYTVSEKGMQVSLNYAEGLPLREGSSPFIFKTFILDRWLSPSVVSGTGVPSFQVTGNFARTLLPGNHNFVETVLLEPAVDPLLPASVKSALTAANIRYIRTFKDLDIMLSPDDILLIGFDNIVRQP